MGEIFDFGAFRNRKKEEVEAYFASIVEPGKAIREMHLAAAKGLERLGNSKYAKLTPQRREDYRKGLSLYLLNWILTLPAFRQVLKDRSKRLGRPLDAPEVHALLKEMIMDPLS